MLGTASPRSHCPGLLDGAFYLLVQGIQSQELRHFTDLENGWDHEGISFANKGLSAGIQAIFGNLI